MQIYPFVDGGGVCWNKWAPGEGVVVCAEINEGGGSVCILHILQSYWYAIIVAWAILVILAKKHGRTNYLSVGKVENVYAIVYYPYPHFFAKNPNLQIRALVS